MPHSTPKLSVILPAFNEKENIPLLIHEIVNVLSGRGESYEIILVDDGSTDGTCHIASDLVKHYPGTKYIRLKKNYGLSTALMAGYENSSAEIIITMDSDLQYDAKDIIKLIDQLGEHGCDLVCGWRHKRCDSFLRRISSRIANFIRNKSTGDNINDAGCIFRVFRRESIKKVWLFNGFHRFLPVLFKLRGQKVMEVKVSHFPRKQGKSKSNIRNRIFVAFLDMLAVKWMKKREIDYEISEKVE